MTKPTGRPRGRPGKGERLRMQARVPVAVAEQLLADAAAAGVPISEYLATVLTCALQRELLAC